MNERELRLCRTANAAKPLRDALLVDHALPRRPGRIHDVDRVAGLGVLREIRAEALRRESPELPVQAEIGAPLRAAEEGHVRRQPEWMRMPRDRKRRDKGERTRQSDGVLSFDRVELRALLEEGLDLRE